MTRVVLVADGRRRADDLRASLRFCPGLQLLGFVDGRGAVLPVLETAAPDVVLLDDPEPALLGDVRRALGAAKLLVLADDMAPGRLDVLARAGADAVLHRDTTGPSLGTLVREIVRGRVYHRLPSRPAAAVPAIAGTLTGRELEVLRLVAAGVPNARIARQLVVSEQTVKFHLSNVYRKLGVANRTAAARAALQLGLIDGEPRPWALEAA